MFTGGVLFGQQRGVNRDAYRISIEKTAEAVEIDGVLEEAVWQKAQMVTDFRRVLPTDTGFAVAQTEVRLLYNETTLFVGVVCLDPTPGKRPVESLRRDFAFLKNDNFIVFIDTYNDQTNGFAFGVSPAGAQWDGMQANGGSVNLDWDIKWRSEVKNYPDRWTAEFAIPFRSLRYLGGAGEWGINFSRHDLKTAEKSSWAPMPRQFATATLAFTGSLVWDHPLPPAGLRLSVIPYGIARVKQNPGVENRLIPGASAGLDAKMILSTSMNLDLTLLPDYSQVEVDRQQINLDRFELFFPEKRQFYLENSDLFASLGTDNLRPFFSRRIGLNAPVLAGARLSGKLGSDWRIGVMDIQTDKNGIIPAANFGVTAIQKKVFRRSSVTAFMVNKVTTGTRDSVYPAVDSNQVGGLEFNLASADNRWTGKAFYHRSFYPGVAGNNFSTAANITYSTQHLMATLNQSWVGDNFLAEAGYIRRKGYYELAPLIQYKFYPASKRIANHGPALKADLFLDPRGGTTDRDITLMYQVEWLNKSILQVELKDSFLELQFPFDPTNSGGQKLAKGQSFHWQEAGIYFASDLRKPFNVAISTRYGGYFNGTRLSVNGELYYRIQPYSSLALVTTFNSIDLPSPYSSASFILIGPRLDITLTDKLFLTGLVQYNNQIDNINLNFRFQWRFAPVSDLYIVYTENSSPLDYRVKDRGLVVKVSYWIN